MNRLAIALLLAGALLPAAPDDLPKGETILDHYVEVTGGKAAYDKIHNQVAKGTMEFSGKGLKGTLASYQAEPNKEYSVIEIESVGKIESGTDGEVAWERSAMTGARVKSGDERDEMLRASTFNAHVNWRSLYDKAETQGMETVEGEECYKVQLTPKSGRPETEYYSKKTGLLLRTTSVHTTQMGDIPSDSIVKDYKEVSGVTMPFTRVNKFAGQEIDIHLDSIEFNVELPKDRFDLPDDVKALLRKNGAIPDAK